MVGEWSLMVLVGYKDQQHTLVQSLSPVINGGSGISSSFIDDVLDAGCHWLTVVGGAHGGR